MQRTTCIACNDAQIGQRIARALTERGYSVRTVQNCEDLRRLLLLERIDLLILEHRLPEEGGLALLQWLRLVPQLNSLPIIMLTSGIEEVEVYMAWQGGVASFQSTKTTALGAMTVELLAKVKRIFKSLDEEQERNQKAEGDPQ